MEIKTCGDEKRFTWKPSSLPVMCALDYQLLVTSFRMKLSILWREYGIEIMSTSRSDHLSVFMTNIQENAVKGDGY